MPAVRLEEPEEAETQVLEAGQVVTSVLSANRMAVVAVVLEVRVVDTLVVAVQSSLPGTRR